MLSKEKLDGILEEHRGVRLYRCDVLDGLRHLPSNSIQCVVTSPPYWGLRDYGVESQIGLEETPELYVNRLVEVFHEVRRVLTDDGTLWLNLGDSYAGSMKGLGADGKHYGGGKQITNTGSVVGQLRPAKAQEIGLKSKDLVGIPWMVAFALRADGWYLRQDIIWAKPNPMPESVKDRCTKGHEYLFLLTKSSRYFFNVDAIKEPAVGGPAGNKERKQRPTPNPALAGAIPWAGGELRQKRSVWTVIPQKYKAAHFATFPEKLVEPCLLAGSAKGDIVMDVFSGSGTVGVVAKRLGRRYVGLELNKDYVKIAKERIFGKAIWQKWVSSSMNCQDATPMEQ